MEALRSVVYIRVKTGLYGRLDSGRLIGASLVSLLVYSSLLNISHPFSVRSSSV